MNLDPFALCGYPQIAPSAEPFVRWRGKSGLIYEAELHALGTTFLNLPGVYIVCRSYATDLWLPLYVGEAQDIDGRVGTAWSCHEKASRAQALRATHICTLIVYGTDAQRRTVEADLRHGLRPPLNDQ